MNRYPQHTLNFFALPCSCYHNVCYFRLAINSILDNVSEPFFNVSWNAEEANRPIPTIFRYSVFSPSDKSFMRMESSKNRLLKISYNLMASVRSQGNEFNGLCSQRFIAVCSGNFKILLKF